MGITLASNFDVNAALPLDSRMIVADLTARDAIAAGRRFQGMCVYVVADTLTYQLKTGILNADWVEYGGGAGAAVTYVQKFSGDGGSLTFTL
ncbi:MAG TPA: alpha amylase C-terminal domain-containing protein, partial [Acinetobacter sp.]|nr:alpha amylase C-terminal domain-containing protein [Acinetobacter sp.]